MMRSLTVCALAAACAASASLAQVPVPITQWNFNSSPPDTSNATGTLVPNIGAGTAQVFNLTTSIFDSAGANSSDPATSDNTAWRVAGNAPQGSESGNRGVQFSTSTVNFDSVIISWDQRYSSTAARHMQVFYSVDGTSFTAFPQYFSPPAGSTGDIWVKNHSADLTLVPGVANNPNFKFRICGVFAPGENVYFAASESPADVYGAGGNTQRYDMVTVSGVPVNQTNPSGTGTSLPQAVCPNGGSVKLTVAAVGGLLPASTNLQVRADLSSIGGSLIQLFVDDGTNGDDVASDSIFTYVAIVPAGVPVGPRSLPATISDAQLRSGAASISFSVVDCATNSPSRVVISQVYGGGGNLGPPAAIYNADFIELYNRSAQTVSLSGWSVQYASPNSAGGFDSAGDSVALSGSIKPGQYLLVRMSDPSITGQPIPAPDFVNQPGLGGIGNNAGRVALVRTTTLIGANCGDVNIEDFVGYGAAASCFEGGAPTATTTNDTAAIRALNGAQDVNQNFNDFSVSAPAPRNRATGGFLVGQPAASVPNVCAGAAVTLSVSVIPGQSPASTSVNVAADLSTLGGASSVALLDNGLNGDQTPGDGIYTLVYTVPGSVTQGFKAIIFTTTDAQSRADTASITLGVGSCANSSAAVVISQVFSGGGNDGSIFNADFIEIFNRSQNSVNLTGWSVQYADAVPAVFSPGRVIPLAGTIAPGEHRLIVTNVPSATNGVPVPATDFAPPSPFGMDNQFGRVAIVNTTTALGANCTSASIVDFVGYGATSGCYEGLAPAANLSNVTAAIRKEDGCQDTNQTILDFEVATPFDIPKNSASPATPCPATNVNCCRGTTCASIDAGACTGSVAGSTSVIVGSCGAGNSSATCCFADFSHSGGVTIDDLFLYLNAYFTSSPFANFGGDTIAGPTIDDLFLYINAYFTGCQP